MKPLKIAVLKKARAKKAGVLKADVLKTRTGISWTKKSWGIKVRGIKAYAKRSWTMKFCVLLLGLFLMHGMANGKSLRDQDKLKNTERIKVVSKMHYENANAIANAKNLISRWEDSSYTFSDYFGIGYSPKVDTYFSLNLGRPFLMPSTEYLFSSTLNCLGAKHGDDDPEYGWNFDLSIQGCAQNHKLKYDVTFFYNTLEEFVNETPLNDPGEDFSLKITDPELMGGEYSISYRFDHVAKAHNSLFIGTGGSYLYGIDRSGEKDASLFAKPPFKVNTNLTYQGMVNKNWLTAYSIRLEHNYISAQNSLTQNTYNLSLELYSSALPSQPKVRMMMSNILNTYYASSMTYNQSLGRNIKVLVSLTF